MWSMVARPQWTRKRATIVRTTQTLPDSRDWARAAIWRRRLSYYQHGRLDKQRTNDAHHTPNIIIRSHAMLSGSAQRGLLRLTGLLLFGDWLSFTQFAPPTRRDKTVSSRRVVSGGVNWALMIYISLDTKHVISWLDIKENKPNTKSNYIQGRARLKKPTGLSPSPPIT